MWVRSAGEDIQVLLQYTSLMKCIFIMFYMPLVKRDHVMFMLKKLGFYFYFYTKIMIELIMVL